MTKKSSAGLALILGFTSLAPYHSDYATPWGNGVIIVGDRYVKSGKWVYDCDQWRLVSKKPIPFPTEHFKIHDQIEIDLFLYPPKKRKATGEFINHVLSKENWYNDLRYTDTYINESSQIYSHRFTLTSVYNNEQWVLSIRQRDNLKLKRVYSASAEPYDARHHKSHSDLLQAAKTSCPGPQ